MPNYIDGEITKKFISDSKIIMERYLKGHELYDELKACESAGLYNDGIVQEYIVYLAS